MTSEASPALDERSTALEFALRPILRRELSKLAVPRWKRILDLVVGSAAFVLLSPLMLLVACLVRLESHGPALFRQTRVGHGGRLFTMLKFRTMYQLSRGEGDFAQREAYYRELAGSAEKDPETELFRPRADPRVTPVGRALRLLSIDELPQLVNVLRGEMSLVGPRPALLWEAQALTAEQWRRHAVPPGMTGLWQVYARNRVSSLDMIRLDLEYVDRLSIWLDLRLLLLTPRAVLFDRHTR